MTILSEEKSCFRLFDIVTFEESARLPPLFHQKVHAIDTPFHCVGLGGEGLLIGSLRFISYCDPSDSFSPFRYPSFLEDFAESLAR